jgi:CheY-like chemotaxis protein
MPEKKTVLAIDDDPDILEVVKSVLSPFYRVIIGGSGKECFELIGNVVPDLILLDVMMAHLSEGFDCVEKIKSNPATKHIPIVMMTSVDQVYDYRTQIDESHFPYNRWLNKPVEADVLLKTVREILG